MRNTKLAVALAAALGAGSAAAQTAPTPNGIELPQGYKDWRVISVSDRSDSHTLRVIVGNDVAVAAARSGRTNPWPEGAALGKVAWKETTDPKWQPATVPGDLSHVEFMIKDSRKFSATGGWGFARWRGMKLEPYGKDASFVQECFGCHTPARDQDYVFTQPARMP